VLEGDSGEVVVGVKPGLHGFGMCPSRELVQRCLSLGGDGREVGVELQEGAQQVPLWDCWEW